MRLAVILFVLLITGVVHPVMAAKCMLVMSYQKGYAWNDGVQKGIETVLSGKCDLKIFYMDAKREKSPQQARRKAGPKGGK